MNQTALNVKWIKYFSIIEIFIIVVLAIVPLFLTFPYRVNIFLTWEGAFRLYEGQTPYKDFGMPLGYTFWVVPAIFFKIFGTQLITLIKAQVFINIISGLAFRSILKSLDTQPGVRLLSVIVYCVSYSFFNFWPWYNHTVIVYEFIGLAFLFHYIFKHRKWYWLVISALFIFCSFFTKQDSGALAIILSSVILFYHCFTQKNFKPFSLFIVSMVLIATIIIAPLTKFNFTYWFNYGQPPHTSRFSIFDIISDFLATSPWIKFYLFIIILLSISFFKTWKQFFSDSRRSVLILLTLGILAEAAILQVTSYTPPDNNIFYHSFSIACILSLLSLTTTLDFNRFKPLLIGSLGIMLWWSGVFWKYIERIAERAFPKSSEIKSSENLVNRDTYMIKPETNEIPDAEWVFSDLKTFDKIYMPKPTAEGIKRILNLDVVKKGQNLRVLNMTELTPLAVEIPYKLETGSEVPLWYHLGVSMFNKDAQNFENKIAKQDYDLVLFEFLPTLNNFYPFRVRDSLKLHYQQIDSFPAPRRGDSQGTIEVYIR